MPSPHDQEFVLHLYDKLWENINQKESRVWTFLSVYGAVIAIAVGSESVKALGFYGVFAVLLLTYWAIQIVFSADWWSIRNRLMVGRIERRFPHAVAGLIPRQYEQPAYSTDALNGISLLVLTLIAWLFYFRTVLDYSRPGAINDFVTLLQLVVLYFTFIAMVFFALAGEEAALRAYYDTYLGLCMPEVEPGLAQRESEDRRRLRRREILATLVAAASLPLYAALFRSQELAHGLLLASAALLAVAGILVTRLSRDYYRQAIEHEPGNADRYLLKLGRASDRRMRWAVRIFVLSCIVLVGAGAGNLPWSSPRSATQLAGDLDQLKTDLAALQKKTEALGDRVTGRPEYLRREDAGRLYLKASDPRLSQAFQGISRLDAAGAQAHDEIAALRREVLQLAAQHRAQP
jgi:hypothetical protein